MTDEIATQKARELAAELRVCIQRGLLATLGDTYDCTRVWSAWGYRTMDQDDFRPVLDRMDELIDAISYELRTALAAQGIKLEGEGNA